MSVCSYLKMLLPWCVVDYYNLFILPSLYVESNNSISYTVCFASQKKIVYFLVFWWAPSFWSV